MIRVLRHTLPFLLVLAATTFGSPLAQSQLPPSEAAPKVGQKAPDFTLPDSTSKPFTLSDALAKDKETAGVPNRPAWVLLIFYRGYW